MIQPPRSRRDWVLLVTILLATLILRWSLLDLEPPSHLTFSDGPYTDEGWKSITSLNFLNDPDYAYSEANYLTDRIHYAAPVQGLVNYLAMRVLGRGIRSRRVIAFAMSSLIFLLTAVFVLPRRDVAYGAFFLVLISIVFPIAYFYRLGNGYDLALALMVAVFWSLTRKSHSIAWMAAAGVGAAILLSTVTLHAAFFVGACLLWSVAVMVAENRDTRSTLGVTLAWFWFSLAAVCLAVYFGWMAPHKVLGFDVVESRLPDGLGDVARNILEAHIVPLRLHTPFLLSLFAVGSIAEARRWRHVGRDRVFLILWVLCCLGWMSVLSYRPSRYLQFSIFPMVVLAAFWIGDLITRSGAYEQLRNRTTILCGGLATLAVLFASFAPRNHSGGVCSFVALSACDDPKFLWGVIITLAAIVVAIVVGDLTLKRHSSFGLLAPALFLGVLVFNSIQLVNWARHNQPYTEPLQTRVTSSLLPSSPVLLFNGPYLYNYLLGSEGVIYTYNDGFDERYIEVDPGTVLVRAGHEIESTAFFERAARAGLRFEPAGRIDGFPKIDHASVFRRTEQD